ncbi:MAG: hypothetical protein ACKV22_14445 [Bryobacteraceae bacterium]
MQALAVWKAAVMDHANFLEGLLGLLSETRIRYCVIGGQGVNAYVDPLISLDLDIVVAVDQLEFLEAQLRRHYSVNVFPHPLNVSAKGSNLRVQIQTDPRYAAFAERAEPREVLGLVMPVARIDDLLQGKIWAASDPTRRPAKRRKELLDIERVIEAYPELKSQVPADILRRLDSD